MAGTVLVNPTAGLHYRGTGVKHFILLALLTAGCASAHLPARDVASQKFAQQSQHIAEMEQQCIDQASQNTGAELAQIARTPDSLAELRNQAAITKGRSEVARCRAEADHLNERISIQQRAEYERQAQEERQRSSLMSILTISRTH